MKRKPAIENFLSRRGAHWVAVTAGIAGLVWSSLSVAADPAEIIVKDFMFSPTSLKVKAGSTVTWTNHDGEPHTVFSGEGLFRSSALDTNDHFSYKFDHPGTYHYVCTIHPRMVGTIVVE